MNIWWTPFQTTPQEWVLLFLGQGELQTEVLLRDVQETMQGRKRFQSTFNNLKQHCNKEYHKQQMISYAQNAQAYIEQFSSDFEKVPPYSKGLLRPPKEILPQPEGPSQ